MLDCGRAGGSVDSCAPSHRHAMAVEPVGDSVAHDSIGFAGRHCRAGWPWFQSRPAGRLRPQPGQPPFWTLLRCDAPDALRAAGPAASLDIIIGKPGVVGRGEGVSRAADCAAVSAPLPTAWCPIPSLVAGAAWGSRRPRQRTSASLGLIVH